MHGPPQEVLALLGDQPRPGNGSIFIGTQGVMVLPHVGAPFLLPKAQFADYKMPKVTGASHNDQFIDAVLGKGTTSASFDYSGCSPKPCCWGPCPPSIRRRPSSGTAPRSSSRTCPKPTAMCGGPTARAGR